MAPSNYYISPIPLELTAQVSVPEYQTHDRKQFGGVIPYNGSDQIVALIFDVDIPLAAADLYVDPALSNSQGMQIFCGYSNKLTDRGKYTVAVFPNTGNPHYPVFNSDVIPPGALKISLGVPAPLTVDTWFGFNFFSNGSGYSISTVKIDNFRVVYQIVLPSGIPSGDHEPGMSCGDGDIHRQEPATQNPIRLRTGEKILSETDITIQSAPELLTFTRSYMQNKHGNANFKAAKLGLGWTHNHNMRLTITGAGSSWNADVLLADGGILKFTGPNATTFTPKAGSASTLVPVSSSSDFNLTSPNKVVTRFEPVPNVSGSYRIKSRTWPNTEVWTYSYYQPADGPVLDGKLKLVTDSYSRQLTFTYFPSGDTKAGQLQRVTDHTGRYIEFNYSPDGLEFLLTSVKDVRGNTWEYAYYSGTGLVHNYLITRLSPPLAGGSQIALEKLDYTFNATTLTDVTQLRGLSDPLTDATALLKTKVTLPTGSSGDTYAQQKEVALDSLTTKHWFTNGLSDSIENPLNQRTYQRLNSLFRPSILEDANGKRTMLAWNSQGKRLISVYDALGHSPAYFDYDGQDRLQSSTDAEGRRVDYTYDSGKPNSLVPTMIKAFDIDGTTTLLRQEFTYDTKDRLTLEKVVDPNSPTTILQQVTREYVASGNGAGLLWKVKQHDSQLLTNTIDTEYTYDGVGRVIKTRQSSVFGSCQYSYTVYDNAGNVLATVCGPQNATPPADVTAALAMYDVNDPNKKDNRVTTYEYDALERRVKTTVNAGATFAQTSVTVYDALSRVTRSVANYIDQGEDPKLWVWSNGWKKSNGTTAINHGTNNDQNVIADTAYNKRGLVKNQRDVLGNVTLYGYDKAGRLIKTVQNASQSAYNNDYDGTSPDPELLMTGYTVSNSPDKDIIAVNEYDKAGNLVKTTDPLATVNYTVYDSLNRAVKTVRSAKASATLSLNPGDTNYAAANDPRSTGYTPSIDPDRDLINETVYDSLGRVVSTQRLLENRPSEIKIETLYLYDALGRQWRTIENYQPQGTTDPATWVWDSSQLRWEKADGTAIAHGSNDAQNIITDTAFDTSSRLLQTFNTYGVVTRSVYDGFNRPVKSIANYVAQGSTAVDPKNWVWSTTNNRWERGAGGSPTAAINYDSNNDGNQDENIIYATYLDSDGRVIETRDVLGRVTRNVYDSVGRLIRTIKNYVAQASSDPKNWVWGGNGWQRGASDTNLISFGTNYDQNQIATTVYDAQGRVSKTIDHQNNETVYVYDTLGRRLRTIRNYIVQGSSDPKDWVWSVTNNRWERGASDTNPISFGTNNDQNQINVTTYDVGGRITGVRETDGMEMRYLYDAIGRRVRTVGNYVVQGSSDPKDWVWDTTDNRWERPGSPPVAIDHGTQYDRNLISDSVYNKGSQVEQSRDARGTQTLLAYDRAGRQLTVRQAVSTALEVYSYTCYDKGGRVLRTIQNWVDSGTSPDSQDVSGNWLFDPMTHGTNEDTNLITRYTYDSLMRQKSVTNPVGNVTSMAHFRDGLVRSMTDPMAISTQYRYDKLGRQTRVVQGYVSNGEDPANWIWSGANGWTKADGTTAIATSADFDQNIMVLAAYDAAGRMKSRRNPRGHLTQYNYDFLDRRLSLTNPLSKVWQTAYPVLTTGGTRMTMTYPGITHAANYPVHREFDRLGRLMSIAYGDPATTPDVKFTYDAAGNRMKMSEYNQSNFANRIRETNYSYDADHRLISAGFDNDGNGTVDETVSYLYDVGGLRTRLTLPSGLNVTYMYDAKGQIVSLTDWDSQQTNFEHDRVRRLLKAKRPNSLVEAEKLISNYSYDAAGRLLKLYHATGTKTLGYFEYQVDARGNRTQVLESLPRAGTPSDTTVAYNDKGILVTGTWSNVSGFKETPLGATTNPVPVLEMVFEGNIGSNVSLTMGTGPTHGRCNIYLDDYSTPWQTFEGYAASAGQQVVTITLAHEGPHRLKLVMANQKHASSTNYRVRFKQLVVSQRIYDLHTVEYIYDDLARIQEARYNPGINTAAADADLLHRFQYNYGRGGNLVKKIVTSGGTTTTTDYEHNDALQITRSRVNAGTWSNFTYDNNGNLINDGTYDHSWDRANRLVAVKIPTTIPPSPVIYDHDYKYDGLGNRIKKTLTTNQGVIQTPYLLDLQPGLPVMLREGSNIYHVHGPRGIHAHKDASSNWEWILQDGLGSVRGVASNTVALLESRIYDPYGNNFAGAGTQQTSYHFTGELMDSSGLLYLRARNYNPSLGVFPSLDPFEGTMTRPMSLNGYSYVEGNPTNWIDPSGLYCSLTSYLALLERKSTLIQLAQKWNRISLSDCIALTKARPFDQCGSLCESKCQSGLSDEAFAYLMASILHLEGIFQGRVAGGNVLENITGSIGGFVQSLKSRAKETAGTLYSYIGGDNQFDSSEGVAKVRPNTMRDILQGIIPAPNDAVLSFNTARLESLKQQYIALLSRGFGIEAGTPDQIGSDRRMLLFDNPPFSEEAQLFTMDDYFLGIEGVSLELLAANLYRGILRVKSGLLVDVSEPTIFNLAAWHNEGIQGGSSNPYNVKAVGYGQAIVGIMVDFVEGECDLGFGKQPVPWVDFLYYNDTDEAHLPAGWKGTRRPSA